jgi:hypothetical protein
MLASNRHVNTHCGRRRVDAIAAETPREAWQTYSAGAGSKGPRSYDSAWHALLPEGENDPTHHHRRTTADRPISNEDHEFRL